jgi:hypothetical protein
MAKTATQPAPTFTLEQMEEYVRQAVERIPAVKAAASKADGTAKMEELTVRAFKRAGYDNIEPRKNILTYRRWLAEGRIVIEGQKAVRVKSLALFHVSQTRPMVAEDHRKVHEREARRNAGAGGRPSEAVQPAPEQPKPATSRKSKAPAQPQQPAA